MKKNKNPAAQKRASIRYRIAPSRPEAHFFSVHCEIDAPDADGQRLALPAWIPGSYMIREFARHIVSIRAEARGRPARIDKLDKHTWRVAPVPGTLVVRYEVYAWDLSVRGAHLDTTHGFFNGASVFLRVLEHEQEHCAVQIDPPAGARYRAWRVATSLPRLGAPAGGFGGYAAGNYDELIDHPVEMGTFASLRFRACGVPHEMAITGVQDADTARLARDLKKICETQIRFWNAGTRVSTGLDSAPMERYVFLTTALGEGYGGLEHRASTALMCSRGDLPKRGVKEVSEAYRGFLGLCSHEYFHTWNVKRLKPAAFVPYDLDRENYTSLLWVFEGFTSYYDDLMLLRAGVIDRDSYLELLACTITNHLRTPGRTRQSVAEASFDAWIKYYRQDENSPNAAVSYYVKGSLVALCLDLHIRQRTRGGKSLDDLMHLMWKRRGLSGEGVGEEEVEAMAEEATGLKLRAFFDSAVRGTAELPLARLLAAHGVRMRLRAAKSAKDRGGLARGELRPARARPDLGVRSRVEGKEIVITHVLEGGAAQQAGLAAGDAIVSVDELRPVAGGLDAVLGERRPGQMVGLRVFRRDEMHAFSVRLRAAPADTCELNVLAAQGAALRRAWLGVGNE
ncbi:MAG: M61 family peptidase [Betaproteobacteria bacterium]|nr:M61 family peptidase [Betaproteobacteria bacterium]